MALHKLTRRNILVGLAGAYALKAEKLKAGKSTIDIEISEGAIDVGKPAIIDWLQKAISAVEGYYGRFPVPVARVEVNIVEGRESVFNGVTWGRVPTLTKISVGQHITQEGLDRDWVATHELVHLAFPSVPRRHHWIEEGLSTYIEPLARLHLKQITEDVFWRDMMRDMPQGQPGEGDRGMDNTHTWGRTYWGGAIYWLRAELMIRERTSNKKGLQDALRGILNKVGSIQEDVELMPVLQAGDRAIGTTVLTELYARVKDQPDPMDLAEMWKSLGLSWHSGRLTYDDKAHLAMIRKAIVTPMKS